MSLSLMERMRVWAASRRPVRRVRVRMDFARTPDPQWQAALDAAFPPCELTGRLVIVWDAGDRWQPVHRWSILEVQPWEFVDEDYKAALLGPHPRTDAKIVQRWAVVDGVLSLRSRLRGPYIGPIDRTCWETARALRARGIWGMPRRVWIIQGRHGGQPWELSPSEQKYWQTLGKTHYAAGDLPYAEFDQRVITAIREHDLSGYATDTGTAGQFVARATMNRRRALERKTAELTWQGYERIADDIAPQLAHAYRRDGFHRLRMHPVGYKPPVVDLDEVRDAFLNDLPTEASA